MTDRFASSAVSTRRHLVAFRHDWKNWGRFIPVEMSNGTENFLNFQIPRKKDNLVRLTEGAYHLARKSGNFGLKSNGKVIFQKFRSEIVEYLQRYSSFFVRNGTAEISYHLLNFPVSSLSSAENNYGKSKCKW